MSTVRIQVRRGTASQWTSVNPILAAGEMGVESDSNLFKFGNGSSTWTALAYANNSDVAIGEISQDAINTALSMGAGLTKTYNDGSNTITISVDSDVIALKSYVDAQVSGLANQADLDYLLASDLGMPSGVASLNSSGKVPAAQLDIAETVQDNIASAIVAGAGITKEYNDAANTITIISNISNGDGITASSGTGTERIFKIADSIHPITAVQTGTLTATTVNAGTIETTGNGAVGGNLTITGNLTVNGTSTTVNSTNVSYDDPMIYMGDGNQSNVLDLGLVAAFNNGTYQHAGLVRDASDGFWKLFSGVTSEPGTTVDFTTYTKDNLEIGGLYADAARIGDVLNTEIQHLSGVTSPIQTQLNAKLSSIADGSVTASKIDTGAVTSEKIANGTIVNLDINAAAAIDYTKLNLTGAVLSTDLSDSAITEAKLAANAVTNTKVLDGTLTGVKLVDGTVSAEKLGTASVTTAKITDGNVTEAKLAPLSVAEAKIAASAVSADKIAASAVTTAKIADGHVTEAKLADGAVTVAKIADDSVTDTKIANSAVTETKLAANAVTTGKIAEGTIINADINAAAEIAKTKIAGTAVTLADTGSVTNAMLAGSIAQDKVVNLTSDLATKATIDAPTFTGAVVLPATTSIGLVDATEIGYLNGVTSGVQSQLTALGSANTAHSALTANVHGIADTSVLATATTVATAKSEAIAAAGTAADTKVSTAVAALTKSSVGLGNVDNTADASKPVSTAQATAIATAKSEAIADATSQVNALLTGAPAALNTLDELAAALGDDANFASTVTTNLAAKAPLASPTFTGTVTLPAAGIVFSDGTQARAGVPSITTFGSSFAASATLAAGEQDKFIPVAGAVVITLPATGYSTGQSIDFYQASGTGASFASTNSVVGTPGLKFRTTNSVVTAMKTAAGWLIFGDLSA